MEWIVKIENEKKQRIRIVFNPLDEKIWFYGEVKLANNEWHVFSHFVWHGLSITLKQIQENMELCIHRMRGCLKEYENLDKGFSVLKIIAYSDDIIDE